MANTGLREERRAPSISRIVYCYRLLERGGLLPPWAPPNITQGFWLKASRDLSAVGNLWMSLARIQAFCSVGETAERCSPDKSWQLQNCWWAFIVADACWSFLLWSTFISTSRLSIRIPGGPHKNPAFIYFFVFLMFFHSDLSTVEQRVRPIRDQTHQHGCLWMGCAN